MHHGRVIFECPVLNGNELVYAVSRATNLSLEDLRSPQNLHLTLLYVGSIKELGGELDLLNFSLEAYPSSAEMFIQHTLRRGRTTTHASVMAVETLVSEGTNYVVAKVEPSDKLADMRNDAWNGLMSLLESLGVSNSEAFARKSSVIDLRGKTWFPHITMAKDAKTEPVVLSSPLEVVLGPLRLHS